MKNPPPKEFTEETLNLIMEAVLNPIFSHGNIRNIIHAQLTQLAYKAEERDVKKGALDGITMVGEVQAAYERGAKAMKEKVLACVPKEMHYDVIKTLGNGAFEGGWNNCRAKILTAITNISLSE